MTAPRDRFPAPTQSRDRRAGWLFVFYLALFTLTNAGFDSSEGMLSYRQAELLLADGRLDVDGEGGDVNYFTGPDGHRYSARELGGAVAQLPAAAVNAAADRVLAGRMNPDTVARGKNFVAALQPGLFTAAAVALFYRILRDRYRTAARPAWLLTFALVATTFVWSYSRSLFDGVLVAPFVVGALYYLLRYADRDRTADVAVAAALLGAGVAIRISVLFAVVGLFAFLIAEAVRRGRVSARPVLAAVAALAPFGLWVLWYNALRTGSPLRSPMQLYEGQNGLSGDLVEGLTGLLVSPGKGLLVYCPLLVVSAVLFPRYARRDRSAAVFVAVVGGLWLLVHARMRVWYGSWGWGPRHFITIVPLLMLPFAVEYPRLTRPPVLRWAVGLAAVWGAVLSAASIVVSPHYRMVLALQAGRLDDADFIWTVAGAQSVDAVAGALNNIGVLCGTAEPQVVASASPLNTYASNTVNVWVNTLTKAGIHPGLTVGAFLALAAVAAVAGRKSARPDPTPDGP